MNKTDNKTLKMVLTTLCILVLAFFLSFKSYGARQVTQQSDYGPDMNKTGLSEIVLYDVSASGASVKKYLYYCSGGLVDTSYSGTYTARRGGTATYDASSNTLILDNVRLSALLTIRMGDGFKIKLVGDNTVDILEFKASSYRTDEDTGEFSLYAYRNSCTFTGTGNLSCRQIYLDAGYTDSYVKAGGRVEIKVSGKSTDDDENPLKVNYSKYADPVNVFLAANGIVRKNFTTSATEVREGITYYNYRATVANYILQGNDPIDIGEAAVKIPDQTYTGKALTPAPVVTFEGDVLVKDKDYKVTYKNNINVGKGTAIITGINDYMNEQTVTFNINRQDIGGANIKIPDQTYTGKALTPTPSVTVAGRTLQFNQDYQVTYKNNINVGTATATITGINAYKGVKTATFTIKPKPDPFLETKGVIKSIKSNKKNKVTIKWKKISGASGYELNHSKNKSFKKAGPNKIKLKKKKIKDTISSWPSGVWYVRLRAYKKVGGKKIYGKWSDVKKIKVK